MWDVGDMGMWNFGGFKMFRMSVVRDVGCSGFGMFGWMWDVDLQNAHTKCSCSEKIPKSFTTVRTIRLLHV